MRETPIDSAHFPQRAITTKAHCEVERLLQKNDKQRRTQVEWQRGLGEGPSENWAPDKTSASLHGCPQGSNSWRWRGSP